MVVDVTARTHPPPPAPRRTRGDNEPGYGSAARKSNTGAVRRRSKGSTERAGHAFRRSGRLETGVWLRASRGMDGHYGGHDQAGVLRVGLLRPVWQPRSPSSTIRVRHDAGVAVARLAGREGWNAQPRSVGALSGGEGVKPVVLATRRGLGLLGAPGQESAEKGVEPVEPRGCGGLERSVVSRGAPRCWCSEQEEGCTERGGDPRAKSAHHLFCPPLSKQHQKGLPCEKNR